MFDQMYATLHLLRSSLLERAHDDEGATAVEYGLMVALIAIVIITAVALVGTNLDALFTEVAGELG
jgi:pilus assembly protein Flp/PilA